MPPKYNIAEKRARIIAKHLEQWHVPEFLEAANDNEEPKQKPQPQWFKSKDTRLDDDLPTAA